ncbi:copper resistance CopC/CopD family protein [Aquipuribacter sp. MA13-6]|uniref:copper resistance CopC/CopD family protein n=1 Tax=unclassified Aquipuribacter TaxID=2635084 RepID=UPI003EE9FA56
MLPAARPGVRPRAGRYRPRLPLHRGAVVAVLVALLALVLAAPASAHAQLLSTDPADGTVLAQAPRTLTLTFDEPVGLRDDAVSLLDSTGEPVPVQARVVDAEVVVDVEDELADGTYVLTFRVVSSDSHPVTGGSTFSVGAPSAGFVADTSTRTAPGVVALLVLLQALAYGGLLLGAGLVGFVVLVLRGSTPPRALLPTARVAWGCAVLGHVLLVPATTVRQGGGTVGDLLSPDRWTGADVAGWGTVAAVLVGGLLTATVLPVAARATSGRPAPRAAAGTALAGAGVALGSMVAVGHTRSAGPAWLVLSADLAHVVTAASWAGGLVGLVLVARAEGGTPFVTALSRFSALAAWTVAVLTGSGLVLAWRVTGAPAGLLTTDHGRVLLAKLAVVALVLALAGWNRWRLLPAVRRDPDRARPRIRRTLAVEASGVAVAVAVTGLLVISSPAGAGPGAPPPGPTEALVVVEPLPDGELTLTLTPGAVGVNALELELTDGEGNPFEPVDVPTVSLTLPEVGVGPLQRPVSRTGSGAYLATVDAPLPGTWQVEVSVRTSTFDNPVLVVPVEIS